MSALRERPPSANPVASDRQAVTVTGVLTSQRPAVAVAGKLRRAGSSRPPQLPSARRCCRANSMRPSSARRAAMRSSISPVGSRSGRGEMFTVTGELANQRPTADPAATNRARGNCLVPQRPSGGLQLQPELRAPVGEAPRGEADRPALLAPHLGFDLLRRHGDRDARDARRAQQNRQRHTTKPRHQLSPILEPLPWRRIVPEGADADRPSPRRLSSRRRGTGWQPQPGSPPDRTDPPASRSCTARRKPRRSWPGRPSWAPRARPPTPPRCRRSSR